VLVAEFLPSLILMGIRFHSIFHGDNKVYP
jgi:hypothetical protein